MSDIYIYKKGKIVGKSKNLRGISDYHRTKSPVSHSTAKKLSKGEGELKVKYNDGAYAKAKFASYGVLKNCLATKKQRSGWA